MTDRHYIPAMGRHSLLFLYDPITRLAGLPSVHRRLLDQAAVQPRQRVLEIGCGPGDLVLELGRRVPAADVLGIDPDPAALRRGRRKAARRGVPVRFEQAFADALPAPDDSVDRVLSSYMLHHLDSANRAAMMAEVHRVLRPGGELHLVDAAASAKHPLLAANEPEQIVALMRDAGLREAAETGRGHRFGPLGDHIFYRATA